MTKASRMTKQSAKVPGIRGKTSAGVSTSITAIRFNDTGRRISCNTNTQRMCSANRDTKIRSINSLCHHHLLPMKLIPIILYTLRYPRMSYNN